MVTTWSRIKKMLAMALPASAAFLALGTGVHAAEYQFMGSDTLTDVVNQALVNSGLQYNATSNPNGLTYINTGSGQGEKNLCQLSGQNRYQSIAPMSRNMTATAQAKLPPEAAPTQANVVGLDAAVVISRSYTGRCKDLTATPVSPTDPTLAAPDSILAIVMGGPSSLGTGTTAACASAQRLTAIADLAACAGVSELAHFYRRDDNSGTGDTMKEKLQMPRYCNGRAPGGGTTPNMNNDDIDPVRRACVPADDTHALTKCTYYPTTVTCTAGSPPDSAGRPCTQGFLVALSQNDPGAPDITVSIANRIKNDNFNTTMGFAGREAVRQPGLPTAGLTINTINFSDPIVRLNQYMLSRRLFIQHNPGYMTSPAAGDADRFALETQLWNWMTTPDRCNMDPIIRQYGFVTCLDDCTETPSGVLNLCSLPPTNAGSATAPSLPPGAACGSAVCASTGATCTAGGTCPAPAPLAAGNACSVNADCASNTCVIGSNPLAGICS